MCRDDNFLTITRESDGLYKEKGSKFIARMFPVRSQEECQQLVQQMRKEYHDARHHCYAYRLGPEREQFRSNDDGEPSGSAGKPILNQIIANDLFDVLIVVIRYFGGRKLGVGGLVNAYKTAAADAIIRAKVVQRYLTRPFSIVFDYSKTDDVMRVLREENVLISNRDFSARCAIKIEVKKNEVERIISRLGNIREIKIKAL